MQNNVLESVFLPPRVPPSYTVLLAKWRNTSVLYKMGITKKVSVPFVLRNYYKGKKGLVRY
eukprot:3370401-Ditylum_brightwellii.AAC.1